MAVEDVLGDIKFAAGKPLDFWLAEIPFYHLLVRFFPLESGSLFMPETLGVADRAFVGFLVILERCNFFSHFTDAVELRRMI